jgi:hypothetical protein
MKNLKVFACVTAVLVMGITVAACGSSTGTPKPTQTSPTFSSECQGSRYFRCPPTEANPKTGESTSRSKFLWTR